PSLRSDNLPESRHQLPPTHHSDQGPTSSPVDTRSARGADTSDMCFVHSSSYGYKAYRTTTRGSPFITVFTQKVIELARHKEFRDIIQKIQNHFNKEPLSNNKMTLPDFSVQLMNKWF
ncbi:hypothetical protein EGW08_022564, partial [Elysia chlorotica]